jgi:hypothetical protein
MKYLCSLSYNSVIFAKGDENIIYKNKLNYSKSCEEIVCNAFVDLRKNCYFHNAVIRSRTVIRSAKILTIDCDEFRTLDLLQQWTPMHCVLY